MGVNDRIVPLTFASIALAVLGWTAFVMSRPDSDMLSYFADDAFYYLVPAYSFAHGEGWSFDHITRTSGQIDTLFSDDEDARRRLHLERLGYDAAAMYRCVSVEATAMDDSVPNTRYRLFKVDSNCLAALCRNH